MVYNIKNNNFNSRFKLELITIYHLLKKQNTSRLEIMTCHFKKFSNIESIDIKPKFNCDFCILLFLLLLLLLYYLGSLTSAL